MNEKIRRIALMMDFENIVLGLRGNTKFKPKAIVNRVLEVGKVVYKRAYADWSRYEKHKVELHELGFDLLEIPRRAMTGKNSADIRMVVDAMGLVISREHIDTFALVTGDSDFTPLVGSLREHDKHVVGIGVKDSSSKLLIDSCDEFVFYEEIPEVRESGQKATARERFTTSPRLVPKEDSKAVAAAAATKEDGKPDDKELARRRAEGMYLVLDATRALLRDHDAVWASQVKQTLVRKHPVFNEEYHGYATFSKLIGDAVQLGILEGKRDERNGNWRISGVGEIGSKLAAPPGAE